MAWRPSGNRRLRQAGLRGGNYHRRLAARTLRVSSGHRFVRANRLLTARTLELNHAPPHLFQCGQRTARPQAGRVLACDLILIDFSPNSKSRPPNEGLLLWLCGSEPPAAGRCGLTSFDPSHTLYSGHVFPPISSVRFPTMSQSTLSRPAKVQHPFRKAAILFAGGPAPAANAVISTAAVSFLRNEIQVVGVMHGYSHLVEYRPDKPLVQGRDYVMIDHKMLRRTRNSQGILLGTSRTNPGRDVSSPAHPRRSGPLGAAAGRLRRPLLAGGRLPGFHRRRRHAENRQ